jgi:exodeoxyribonuclease VII large subunit
LDHKVALLRHPGDRLREMTQKIDTIEIRLKNVLTNITLDKKNELAEKNSSLINFSPITKIKANQNLINLALINLKNLINTKIELDKKIYQSNVSTLEAVSPLAVLSRGYSIVTDEKNKILSSAKNLTKDKNIKVNFKEGKVLAKVVKKLDEE